MIQLYPRLKAGSALDYTAKTIPPKESGTVSPGLRIQKWLL